MDIQANSLLPVKCCFTSATDGRNYNHMTNITHTAFIVCNDKAHIICTGIRIRMIWIFTVAGLAITKIPLIRDDIMLTGGIIVKMDGKGSGKLFPGELGITLAFYLLSG